MGKKNDRKLRLNKETIRSLDDEALRSVVGGDGLVLVKRWETDFVFFRPGADPMTCMPVYINSNKCSDVCHLSNNCPSNPQACITK